MADYVVDGVNGLYVDSPTAEGIESALRKFLSGSMPFDREKIKTFPERFRWSRIADQVLEVYREHGAR
jgi:glycosyltransferase involved in cell wall biosynthesis